MEVEPQIRDYPKHKRDEPKDAGETVESARGLRHMLRNSLRDAGTAGGAR